jgi:hypothetical protein
MARLISYKVFYRPVGAWRWRVLKDIVEDGIIDNTEVRFFINKKRERIELPSSAIELIFSEDRVDAIEELNRKRIEEIKTQSPRPL